MSKSFYITTPIYYPNAAPHVGTAYTTIICDMVARYKRLTGYDVKFLTGVDEHGQKIQEAAEKNGYTPQQWVDKMSLNFTTLSSIDGQYLGPVLLMLPLYIGALSKLSSIILCVVSFVLVK